MTHDDLKFLLAYHRWANDRILGAAGTLSDDQLHRDLKSSFPSVFATLVHTMSADWVWLERWHGRSPTAFPDLSAIRTLAELRPRWSQIEEGQRAFIDGLTPVAITGRIAYRSIKGDPFNDPLGMTIQHAANHATHHRGQVSTMLRQMGATPPGLDFITFVREAL